MEKTRNALLVAYLATARQQFGEEPCKQLAAGSLPEFIGLAAEAIGFEDLADPALMRHALEGLLSEQSLQQTLFHLFLLHAYKMSANSAHPLERGIIKQKIQGVLPAFKKAFDAGLIPQEEFERNTDALLHIAENTSELPELHAALEQEYRKFETN